MESGPEIAALSACWYFARFGVGDAPESYPLAQSARTFAAMVTKPYDASPLQSTLPRYDAYGQHAMPVDGHS